MEEVYRLRLARDVDRLTVSKKERLDKYTVTVSVASFSFWSAEQSENNRAEAVQVAGMHLLARTSAVLEIVLTLSHGLLRLLLLVLAQPIS